MSFFGAFLGLFWDFLGLLIEKIWLFQKMMEKADNRFLQALDIISSLEEENAQLKKMVK